MSTVYLYCRYLTVSRPPSEDSLPRSAIALPAGSGAGLDASERPARRHARRVPPVRRRQDRRGGRAAARQPAVVGELLGGFVVGPGASRWSCPDETAFVLAEIGVVILLFSVGLEVRMDDLLAVGRPAVLTASSRMVLPIAAGVGDRARRSAESAATAASSAWPWPRRASASPAACWPTGRPRPDVRSGRPRRGGHRRRPGPDPHRGRVRGRGPATCRRRRCSSSVAAVGLVGLGFAAARRARGLKREVFTWPLFADTPLVPAFILMFALALVSAAIGLAAIIGAFVAGLIVAETEARDELEHEMRPLGQIFTPFFFAVTGAQLDLGGAARSAIAVLAVGAGRHRGRDEGRRRHARRMVARALGIARPSGRDGPPRRGRHRRGEPGPGRRPAVGRHVQRGPGGGRPDDDRRARTCWPGRSRGRIAEADATSAAGRGRRLASRSAAPEEAAALVRLGLRPTDADRSAAGCASISSRYGRPMGIRSSHSMYSMSLRAISPSDQPA